MGYGNWNIIERVHLNFLKIIFNLKRSTPSFMIYGKLGIIYIVLLPVWEIAVHLAVACGVYSDVFLCCPFSHELSWMRS